MDKNTFGELVLKSEKTLYHVAKSILHDEEDCEDATQEAIVIAFSKLHNMKNDEYAKTWLIRILINECYRVMKDKKRTVSIENYMESEKIILNQHYTDLYEAISKLPSRYRLTIVLYYLDGFSIAELGKIMKTSEGTIKSRLSRSRKQLKEMLEEK